MNRIATAGPEATIQCPAAFAPSPASAGQADRSGRVVLSCASGVLLLLAAWAGYAGAPSEARPVTSHSTTAAAQSQQNGSDEYSNWLAHAHQRVSHDGEAFELPGQF